MPSRVDIYPPAGWEAEPAEFELPAASPSPDAPETQPMERKFEVTITAAPSTEGRRKLDLEIRYGVKDAPTGATSRRGKRPA